MNKSISKAIKEFRKEKNWTQEFFADKIGVNRITYINYENGTRTPDCYVLKKINEVTGLSVDYILGISETKNVAQSDVAKTTGLSECAIKYLNKTKLWGNDANGILNFILEEEVLPFEYEYMDPKDDYGPSDDLEALYEELMHGYNALDLLQDEWNENDWKDSKEYEMIMEDHLKNFPPDEYTRLASGVSFESYEDEYCRENASKSQLLNSIVQYVLFEKEYVGLNGPSGLEKFTNNHSLTIQMGRKSITFPSKESELIVEQAFIQEIIDNLKIFKKNFKEKYDKN